MSVEYLLCTHFGISLTDGPLFDGLISALFILSGSKHSHTFPFGLEVRINNWTIQITPQHLKVQLPAVSLIFLVCL